MKFNLAFETEIAFPVNVGFKKNLKMVFKKLPAC